MQSLNEDLSLFSKNVRMCIDGTQFEFENPCDITPQRWWESIYSPWVHFKSFAPRCFIWNLGRNHFVFLLNLDWIAFQHQYTQKTQNEWGKGGKWEGWEMAKGGSSNACLGIALPETLYFPITPQWMRICICIFPSHHKNAKIVKIKEKFK